MVGRKKVSFTATKKVPRKRRVNFTTSDGKSVSFTATKKVPMEVNVSFFARGKKSKRK